MHADAHKSGIYIYKLFSTLSSLSQSGLYWYLPSEII